MNLTKLTILICLMLSFKMAFSHDILVKDLDGDALNDTVSLDRKHAKLLVSCPDRIIRSYIVWKSKT